MRPHVIPTIEPWPNHREAPTPAELAEVRALADASEEELMLRQKEVASYAIEASINELDELAGRVVDLYIRTRRDKTLPRRCINPYANGLLDVIEEMLGSEPEPPEGPVTRGASDPKKVKTPRDIGLRLLKYC